MTYSQSDKLPPVRQLRKITHRDFQRKQSRQNAALWLQTTRNNKITCRFFVAAPLVKNQKRALIIAWLYLRPQLKQKCSDPRRRNTSGSLRHRTQMQIHAGKQSRECPHKNWSWLLQYFLTYRVNNKVVTHTYEHPTYGPTCTCTAPEIDPGLGHGSPGQNALQYVYYLSYGRFFGGRFFWARFQYNALQTLQYINYLPQSGFFCSQIKTISVCLRPHVKYNK